MGKGKRASIDSSYMVRLLFRKRYLGNGPVTVVEPRRRHRSKIEGRALPHR